MKVCITCVRRGYSAVMTKRSGTRPDRSSGRAAFKRRLRKPRAVNGEVLERREYVDDRGESERESEREGEKRKKIPFAHSELHNSLSFSNKGDTNELIMRKGSAVFRVEPAVQPPRKRTLRVGSRQSGSSAVPAAIKIKERRTDQSA